MTRKIRPATIVEVGYVSSARCSLQEALQYLKLADCPQAAKAVRHALKSADGAYRHVWRRKRATAEREEHDAGNANATEAAT